MKSNFKKKMFFTDSEMQDYINKEWDKRSEQIFESCKRDIVAQLMAVCCMELNKEFGFGKVKLNRFKNGVEDFLRLINTNGIYGKKLSTQDCIDLMSEKYGIDLDKSKEDEQNEPGKA